MASSADLHQHPSMTASSSHFWVEENRSRSQIERSFSHWLWLNACSASSLQKGHGTRGGIGALLFYGVVKVFDAQMTICSTPHSKHFGYHRRVIIGRQNTPKRAAMVVTLSSSPHLYKVQPVYTARRGRASGQDVVSTGYSHNSGFDCLFETENAKSVVKALAMNKSCISVEDHTPGASPLRTNKWFSARAKSAGWPEMFLPD